MTNKFTTKLSRASTLFISLFMVILLVIGGFIFARPNTKVDAGGINYNEWDMRYTTIEPGNILMIGNSSGIALKRNDPSVNNLAVFDSIGVFSSLDNNLQVAGYPAGTTRDWTLNGSSSALELPTESEVLFAQLTWGGGFRWDNGQTVNKLEAINTPVTFNTASGSHQVSPNPQYNYERHQEENGFYRWLYANSVDVTEYVKQGGAGLYSVEGIPAQINTNTIRGTTVDNVAGWTLTVAYRNYNETVKNLTVFSGAQESNAQPASISGFGTPPVGNLEGYVWVSAMEGDGNLAGDQMQFGDSATSITPISGPNNPTSNFFQSQINNRDGTVDRSGTFGNSNSPRNKSDPLSRQGWDIATVNISDKIKNNQTTAYVRGTTNADNYIITSMGIGIEVYAPRIETDITVDKPLTTPGETLTYTVTATNTGKNNADNVNPATPIPEGTTFIDGTLTSSSTFSGNHPTSELNFGTLEPGESITYSYQVRVNTIPTSREYINQAMSRFSYVMATGHPVKNGQSPSNQVITLVPADATNPPESPGQDIEPTPSPIPDQNITPVPTPISTNTDENSSENNFLDPNIPNPPEPNLQSPNTLDDPTNPAQIESSPNPNQPVPPTPQVLGVSIVLPRTGAYFIFWLILISVIGIIIAGGSTLIGFVDPDDSNYRDSFY